MLQTEYINSANHNYLKLKAGNINAPGRKLRYQYQILTNQKLDGLLQVMMHLEDGETGLYYEISSMQSMSKWFMREKVNAVWLEKLAACLQTVFWSLEEYLLDERNLVIHPDFIFLDMESENICFLYYPYYLEENEVDMEKFLSFLVEHVDETEQDTIEVLYNIFSKWENGKEQFTIKTFQHLWDKRKIQSISEDTATEETVCPVWQEETEEELGEAKESNWKKDFTEFFFGKYKHLKEEEPKLRMAMESREYEADERTAYAEVAPETEERKLYGNGKQNRRVISLEKLPVIIGKKGGMADVILQDASVSRMHARFSIENGQLYLEDLNAMNGTYKNGVRLKPYERVEILKEDEIRLGKLGFTYR